MSAPSISTLQRAGYPLLWAVTQEPARLLAETAAAGCRCCWWDVARGYSSDLRDWREADPAQAIAFAQEEEGAVVMLSMFHRFAESPVVAQVVLTALDALKGRGTTLVVVAPSAAGIPAEWAPVARVVEHQLPDEAGLRAVLQKTLPEGMAIPEQAESAALASGAGMTLSAFEDSLALSLVIGGTVSAEVIWEEKAAGLKKSGGAELYKGQERFDAIGGLEGLKRFCRRSLRAANGGPKARGVMLLGCPGTGKSMFAKALGNEAGRCTISLDMGRMFGSLVGESERMMRETLAAVDRMAPCVLFIDEIEKGLAGTASSGKTDGGTTARVFGSFLTWMNDHTSDVYVVATCNDISSLPPEFLRAERWDGVFFVDLPTAAERMAIWSTYMQRYGFGPGSSTIPACEGWTGAEIRSCCRLAALQNISLEEAARQTIPLTLTGGDRIEATRKGASGRTLSASTGVVYRLDEGREEKKTTGRRAVIVPGNTSN